jgi:hypothetical protein
MDEARVDEELRRFWDAIARDEPAAPGDLDPALAETIRWLHAFRDVPPPDPTYAREFRERLMAAAVPDIRAPLMSPTVNGHAVPPPRARLASRPERVARSSLAVAATAALIVLTLAGSLFAIGSHRWRLERDAPVVIPAALGTSETSPPPGVMEDTVLLQGTVEQLPASTMETIVERITLAPGAAWGRGRYEDDGVGPVLYRVEAGELTIQAEEAVNVLRDGAERPRPVAAGQAVVLGAGDQGFTPSRVRSEWRNAGTVPAVILEARLTTPWIGTLPSGVTTDILLDDYPMVPPPTPTLVTLHQVVLPPSATIALDAVPGVAALATSSGSLAVTEPGLAATPRVLDPAAFASAPNTWSWTVAPFPPGQVVQAVGPGPATLFVVTFTAANPLAATPMS